MYKMSSVKRNGAKIGDVCKGCRNSKSGKYEVVNVVITKINDDYRGGGFVDISFKPQ